VASSESPLEIPGSIEARPARVQFQGTVIPVPCLPRSQQRSFPDLPPKKAITIQKLNTPSARLLPYFTSTRVHRRYHFSSIASSTPHEINQFFTYCTPRSHNQDEVLNPRTRSWCQLVCSTEPERRASMRCTLHHNSSHHHSSNPNSSQLTSSPLTDILPHFRHLCCLLRSV
jgi:hypothetical protein